MFINTYELCNTCVAYYCLLIQEKKNFDIRVIWAWNKNERQYCRGLNLGFYRVSVHKSQFHSVAYSNDYNIWEVQGNVSEIKINK